MTKATAYSDEAIEAMIAYLPEDLGEWDLYQFVARDLKTVRTAARSALAVLKDVEWKGFNPYDDGSQCPACELWSKDGHADDCALAAAIHDLEDVL